MEKAEAYIGLTRGIEKVITIDTLGNSNEIQVGSEEHLDKLCSKSDHVTPEVKGIKQFFAQRLHIKLEKADLKNNIEFFEIGYKKGWIDCFIAHRNSCYDIFEFNNFDSWLKNKDSELAKKTLSNQSEVELNNMKMKILREIPYIGVKEYSHNIIALQLGLISEKYGIATSNQLIKDFKLDTKGWVYLNQK